MKITWLGIVSIIPLLAACNSGAIDISSSSVSKDQLDTIANNINQKYPDAPDWLKQKAAEAAVREIENLVFVKGGTFEMGDFRAPCEIPSRTNKRIDWTPEAKCLSSPTSVQNGSVHLHTVNLDSYSISAYRTRFLDLEWMRYLNGLPVSLDNESERNSYENKNQHIDRESEYYKNTIENYRDSFALTKYWSQAKDYCDWLNNIAEIPFVLPSEAQWEYAARNRGKKVYYATNTGYLQLKEGRYYSQQENRYIEYKNSEVNTERYNPRGGLYPPNSLGIYDMNSGLREWVNDWYSRNYYEESPTKNPPGPKSGKFKVTRGRDMTFSREMGKPDYYTVGFRCAVNATSQILN